MRKLSTTELIQHYLAEKCEQQVHDNQYIVVKARWMWSATVNDVCDDVILVWLVFDMVFEEMHSLFCL